MSNRPHPAIEDLARFTAVTGGYWVDDEDLLHGPNVVPSGPNVLLPEASTQAKIIPRLIIHHSQSSSGGNAKWWQLRKWFANAGVHIEPHLIIDLDGTVAQTVPFGVRADCNAGANSWTAEGERYGAISYETADYGGATVNQTPWTAEQVTTLVGINTALSIVYRIPATPPSTWNGSGIGYHSQFKEWSIYRGKSCPGYERITMLTGIIATVATNVARYNSSDAFPPPHVPTNMLEVVAAVALRDGSSPAQAERDLLWYAIAEANKAGRPVGAPQSVAALVEAVAARDGFDFDRADHELTAWCVAQAAAAGRPLQM